MTIIRSIRAGLALSALISASAAASLLVVPATAPTTRDGAPRWEKNALPIAVNALQINELAIGVDVMLQGETLRITRTRAKALPDGTLVWHGAVSGPARRTPAPEPDTAVFVRSGDRITGNIRYGGRHFFLQPTAAGHRWAEIDPLLLPPDHATEESPFPLIRLSMDQTPEPLPVTTEPTVIHALVVATRNAVADYSGDMRDLAQLAIAETNESFRNSGINASVELVAYVPLPYDQNPFSPDLDLKRLIRRGDGVMDYVHGLRDEIKADVVMLLTTSPANNPGCGRAGRTGATAETAFAQIDWRCGTGRYTFAHELGHLLGARHDIDTDTLPYPFGHGYRSDSRTPPLLSIMAQCPDTGDCIRLNLWSNLSTIVEGQPLGDPDWSDNHRALEISKYIVAGFR